MRAVSDCLERVQAHRRGSDEFLECLLLVEDAHVDVGEKEFGVATLEQDDLDRRVGPHFGEQVPQLAHHRGTQHVDG
ncbi:hypothetical protein [Actinoplanes sp. NBRC 103695]|uniref:hypothetical protein n=1 Tax=Actinoplanes sp. NBRC 103695 TaxID=3032202 RepID=UPI0024A3DFD9|nr:hypothetical protein Acsp02_56070 [Actinoplanes sp. NBRC 103695]